jgi:bifunctional UDP-N-acetylglucosamine pyrophosphorylase/glucosamine-1-phosphate N-acetyltransferase
MRDAGAQRVVVVIGHRGDDVRSALGDDCDYAVQQEQLGTGHAVSSALPLLADWNAPIIVVPGDAPLIDSEFVTALVSTASQAPIVLVTTERANPTGYGRIIRDDHGNVRRIVEEKDATDEERMIKEVGVSIYAFSPAFLRDAIASLTTDNVQGEYLLTDVVGFATRHDFPVLPFKWADPFTTMGVNDRAELAEAGKHLNQRICRRHMLNGVTIVDVDSTFIDSDVSIGTDATIHPFSIIKGCSAVGTESEIGPSARIIDSEIGCRTRVRDSWVTNSKVGDRTTVGPFANIRPGSVIGSNVKIGDFVETKGSSLHDYVSAGHFAYLGDAVVGAHTNIGAGTITCNYDGQIKHRTEIGERAFIGSNSTLVAPVKIGAGAFVAAGSTITDEVPAHSLAIARGRQSNKLDWVVRRKSRIDATGSSESHNHQ